VYLCKAFSLTAPPEIDHKGFSLRSTG